jgi:hypothetical protein
MREQDHRRLRDLLDDEDFDVSYRRGNSLAKTEAVELALALHSPR